MSNDDDDRPRKSWREIDQGRDRSSHRKGDRPKTSEKRLQRSQAYRSYKTQLNKIFDGGDLPDALKEKLQETNVGAEAKQKKEALKEFKAAKTSRKLCKVLANYREKFGFPEDEEVLAQLLDLDDEPEIVLETLQTIERLADEGVLKRNSSFKVRIKTAQMTIDDDKVFALGKKLLAKL